MIWAGKRSFGVPRAPSRGQKFQEALERKAIRKAFDVALDAHKDIRRKSGEPYIYHPIAVARVVAGEMGLGTTSIVCLLHDTVEDTYMTLDDVEQMFGLKERAIVDGLTKMSGVFEPGTSAQAENFRKMLLTLSDDVRVILIKLADRLDNMRTLEHMRPDKQQKLPRRRCSYAPWRTAWLVQHQNRARRPQPEIQGAGGLRGDRARLRKTRPFARASSTRSSCQSSSRWTRHRFLTKSWAGPSRCPSI